MNYDAPFLANPLDTLRTFSVSLPNGPTGYELQVQQNHVPANIRGPVYNYELSGLVNCDWTNPPVGFTAVTRVTLDRLMATPIGAGVTFTQNRHSLVLTFTAAPTGFDCYFLPWTGAGGVVYMTLPAAGGPDIFFTAALSGCSIFVSGPPNNPRVYHCGVDDWNNAPYVATEHHVAPAGQQTPDLWQDLVHYVNNGLPSGFIDKTNYINDYYPGAPPQTTVESRRMEARLKQKKGDNTAQAIPWGAVFGLRDGAGNWSFYLQANVTMQYQKGLWPNKYTASKCRPLQVTKFYPLLQVYQRLWVKF